MFAKDIPSSLYTAPSADDGSLIASTPKTAKAYSRFLVLQLPKAGPQRILSICAKISMPTCNCLSSLNSHRHEGSIEILRFPNGPSVHDLWTIWIKPIHNYHKPSQM